MFSRGMVIYRKEEAVTDPINLSSRVALSPNAIFRLWKAALKDDERLLDDAIAAVHDQMMLSDRVRAERVISMIIRRHRHAQRRLHSHAHDPARRRSQTETLSQ